MILIGSCFSSCSKDDKDDFNYPIDELYGTWDVTNINVDGKWYDITQYPYTKFAMSITFYQNGKYYGSGYLGNGSGTYEAKGNTITTYINNEVYATYTVNSLNSSVAELTMKMGGESLQMKAKKR